jgi:DNA-binding transcriptional ArsR family regulator
MPATCTPKGSTATGAADAVFKALASAQRREVLRILGDTAPQDGKACCLADEVCACKLSERLGLAPSTISHHMNILREAGLVTARKDGLWVHYTLRRDKLCAIAEELNGY